ncbi:PD-(D/E)XK nuclease family protein [Lactobacillaceae bacterium 24-114]
MGRLGFVLGTDGMDHERVLVDQLAEQMKKAAADERFFYLVPNHIKFETEINVLAGLRQRNGKNGEERFATESLQVLSFSRLAWFFLRNTPAYQQSRISKIGMTMLVSKISQENATELCLYASEIKQPGFIEKLTEQLEELKNSNITAENFREIIERIEQDSASGANTVWLSKMHDLSIIYTAYEQQLQKSFMGNVELYRYLVDFLRNDSRVKKMHFFIDRFAQFTAGEQQIVNALIENGASTTVSLVLDRGYPDQSHPNKSELPRTTDLFYSSAILYHRLWKLAQSNLQIKLLPNVLLANESRVSEGVQQVDTYFKRYTQGPISRDESEKLTVPEQVQFYQTANRREELELIATKIRQLVATGKYRYRDFLVLTRHLDEYQTMIKPTFAKHEVPVFNDQERKMDQHPLIVLLDALFNLDHHGYQLEDMMHLLKTWLLVPRLETGDLMPIRQFQEAVFITENWCLKRAIKGKKAWTDPERVDGLWKQESEDSNSNSELEKLNQQLEIVHDYVATTIAPFLDHLKEVRSGKELATILFNFLQENGVTERLYQWQQYQSTRNLDLARQPQQVWEKFTQILQEYVEILGNDAIDKENNEEYLQRFDEILQSGFAAAQYSQIPATLDQVLVSETGIVQSLNKKIVFMMGSTEDVMPEMRESESLLTDQDKQILAPYLDDDYQYLPDDTITALNKEPFVHYLGMMSGKEQLIFTYPQATDDDKELVASPYLRDMARYFDREIIKIPLVNSEEGMEDGERFISSPNATLSQLVKVGRQARDNQQGKKEEARLSLSWQRIQASLVALIRQWQFSPNVQEQELGNHLYERLQLVNRGFNYRNRVDSIGKELAELLYLHTGPTQKKNGTLYTSISQLQDFYMNQYEYFLKYGLQLQKRDRLEMSSDRIGTFFHKAMEAFIENTYKQEISLRSLTDDPAQLQLLTKTALEEAADSQPELKRVAEGSAQASYQYQQLRTIVSTMIKTLCQQAKYTEAQPFKTEAQFGRIGKNGTQLKALDYPLASGNRIYLRGRIDRIDRLVKDEIEGSSDFLTVVDYKSGDRNFDLTRAYYGISLQLLTYLNGLKRNLRELDEVDAKLAGALYLHLSNPKFDWKRNKNKSLEDLQLTSHQYKGLLLNEPDILNSLDEKLADRQSALYPLKVTKDKISAKKDALLVTPAQLQWLQEWTKKLIIGAGDQILAGEIKLNPFRLIEGSHRNTGLDYSEFKDIYQFDNMLDQANYRELDPKKPQEDFQNANNEGGEE